MWAIIPSSPKWKLYASAQILQIKSGRIIDILWLSTISYPTRTRGIIVNYLTLVMDLFYQPSSIRMEHAGLLSSTDAAIYSFKNLAIHQLVQHQPGFRVQHLFLKKHCSKNNQDQKKTCKMFKSKSDQTKLLLKRLSFLFLFSRPC